MSTDNVITPAQFAAQPVKNPKTRGRPKGTVSLRVEKRRREAAEATAQESPYHPCVANLPRPEKGRFHYPKELLLQKCFKNSCGWLRPHLESDIFLPIKGVRLYISSMEMLLKQLEAEGHDVTAPKLEWLAMLETAKYLHRLGFELFGGVKTDVLKGVSWDIEFDGHRPA